MTHDDDTPDDIARSQAAGWAMASDAARRLASELDVVKEALRLAKEGEQTWKAIASRLAAECLCAREYNRLRNAPRGTGVLKDWQQRLSRIRATVDAAGDLKETP